MGGKGEQRVRRERGREREEKERGKEDESAGQT